MKIKCSASGQDGITGTRFQLPSETTKKPDKTFETWQETKGRKTNEVSPTLPSILSEQSQAKAKEGKPRQKQADPGVEQTEVSTQEDQVVGFTGEPIKEGRATQGELKRFGAWGTVEYCRYKLFFLQG